MHLEKEFDVERPRAEAIALAARDDTLLGSVPRHADRDRRAQGQAPDASRSHYTALGREGTATFHFDFRPERRRRLREGLRRPRLARAARAVTSRSDARKGSTRVHIEMDGRTKALVPEFTIRGADAGSDRADGDARCDEAARSARAVGGEA